MRGSFESQIAVMRGSQQSEMAAMQGAMATKEMLERAIRVQTAWIVSVMVFLLAAMGAMMKLL